MAHADIAPQRKDDPGPLFPWQQLAQQGIGAPAGCAQRVNFAFAGRAPHTPVDTASLLELLARYGYDVKPDMTPREQRRVIMAFQMHFRPTLYNGEADADSGNCRSVAGGPGRGSRGSFPWSRSQAAVSRYLHPG